MKLHISIWSCPNWLNQCFCKVCGNNTFICSAILHVNAGCLYEGFQQPDSGWLKLNAVFEWLMEFKRNQDSEMVIISLLKLYTYIIILHISCVYPPRIYNRNTKKIFRTSNCSLRMPSFPYSNYKWLQLHYYLIEKNIKLDAQKLSVSTIILSDYDIRPLHHLQTA